jgi:hypothetical protein
VCTSAKSIDRTTSVPRLQKDKTIAEGKKDTKSKMTRRNHGPKINTQIKAIAPRSAMISAHHPVTVSKGRKTCTNIQKRRRNLTVHLKRASLEYPLQISGTKSMKRRKARKNENNMDMRENSIDRTVPSLVNSNMSSPASFTSDISSATMEGNEKPEKKSGISKDHLTTTSVQTEPNDMEDELSSDPAIRQTQWPEIERAWMSITIIKTRMSNWEHVLSEKDKRGTRATVRDLDEGSWSLHSTHYISLLQNANHSKGLTPPWETPYISFEHIGDEKRFAADYASVTTEFEPRSSGLLNTPDLSGF